jgi:tol-pal system protein YbgF
MIHSPFRATSLALVTVSALVWATAAGAQNSGFLDGLFGGRERPSEEVGSSQMAQMSGADLVVRLERLENQIRQLTGAVEQLQFRNQQLEQQLRGAPVQASPPPSAPPRSQMAPPQAPGQAAPPPSGRRSDVYDPNENPSAPGAPRALGGGGMVASAPPVEEADGPPIGAPGGREPGAPLDLSTLAGNAASDPTLQPAAAGPGLPAPPPRNPNATGAVTASLPPSASPRDEYDLGYGYVLRKDYALAEQTFRGFLGRYGTDARAPDAHYWLGESLFQRQRYREAAESFLTVSTKYETAPKAPDSLLRLGQSLAALGEKETACAALGEIGRKYPRASVTVKQGVEREQKRVRC